MTETDSLKNELLKTLSLFKGLTCWNVSSCGMAGSLELSFGKAIETKVYSMKNKAWKKTYCGQFELLILCSWRLHDENGDPILSSSLRYDIIKTTTVVFLGDTIESIEIMPLLWDVTIRFSSGKQLNVFCDWPPDQNQEGELDGMTNWFCMAENETYYLGHAQHINKGERFHHGRCPVSDTLYEPDQIDWTCVISDKDYQPKEQEEQEIEETDEEPPITVVSSQEKLLETLSMFHGKQCWDVYTSGNGRFGLSFGKAVEIEFYSHKAQALKRRYSGQYELYIVCLWRLDDENGITILGSSNCDKYTIKKKSAILMGDSVESIDVTPKTWDATIRFSSGRRLVIFCNGILYGENMEKEMDNWSCGDEKNIFYIGAGKTIYQGERYNLVSDILLPWKKNLQKN